MTRIIRTEQKGLHHLAIPARVLAAYIKRSESGSVAVNKRLLQRILGLTSDEINIAIGELRLQGLLSREREPRTRKQRFVIHPTMINSNNEYVGISRLRWPSFHGVYADMDYRAYVKSLEKLQRVK